MTIPADTEPAGETPQQPIHVSVFGKTDVGRTREHNEDTFLVADLSLGNASLQAEVRRHVVGSRGSLFVVADGMGGAAAGEIASEMAVSLIYSHLSTIWQADDDSSAAQFAFRMKEAVERANDGVYAYGREHPELRGMGTTVTAAGVFGTALYLAQIGDSRAYLVRDSEAVQLTKDQSLTQRLVDAGELTEEEAEQSERRNIILQALGPDPRVRVDLTHADLRSGDALVICSDGLSGLVRREEIGRLAGGNAALPEVCASLIDLANERGGPDNITVIIARFSERPSEETTEESPNYALADTAMMPIVTAPSPTPAAPAANFTNPERPPDTAPSFPLGVVVAALLALGLLILLVSR